MSVSHIALPYSRAFLNLAMEKGVLEETLADMKVIAQLCHENRDFRLFLKSPIVQEKKKKAVIKSVFGKTVTPLTFAFLNIIVRKKREGLLPEMVDEFIELYNEHKGILTTTLVTAAPVTEGIRKRAVEIMKKHTQKEIELKEEVKEELIGGFVLKWEDKQYDASVATQLGKLKRGAAGINLYRKGI